MDFNLDIIHVDLTIVRPYKSRRLIIMEGRAVRWRRKKVVCVKTIR